MLTKRMDDIYVADESHSTTWSNRFHGHFSTLTTTSWPSSTFRSNSKNIRIFAPLHNYRHKITQEKRNVARQLEIRVANKSIVINFGSRFAKATSTNFRRPNQGTTKGLSFGQKTNKAIGKFCKQWPGERGRTPMDRAQNNMSCKKGSSKVNPVPN